MKALCVLDFAVPTGRRWLWDYLPGNQDEVEFLCTATDDRFARWGKLLTYYPAYLRLGLDALWRLRRERYDVVVAWEGKNGFPLAVWRRLARQVSPPFLILAFSVRGPVARFPGLVRCAMPAVSRVTVPTRREQAYYARLLGFPVDRIDFCPLGIHDSFDGLPPSAGGDYVLTGGRSGRDYATLFAAVGNTPIPVVVNARPFNLAGLDVPANVTCNDILPVAQFSRQLRAARFVVVPLHDVPEAVGLSVALYAMAGGKAVIASRAGGVSDYVRDGETGLLVPPADPVALRQAIEHLWAHPDLAARLGARGREVYAEHFTFAAFAARVHHLLICMRDHER